MRLLVHNSPDHSAQARIWYFIAPFSQNFLNQWFSFLFVPIATYTYTRSSAPICDTINLEPTYPFLTWGIGALSLLTYCLCPAVFVKFKQVGTKCMSSLVLTNVWSQHSQVAWWYSRQSCSLEWNCPGFFFQTSFLGKPSMGLPSLRADSSYNGSKIPSPPVPKLSPLTDHTRGSHFLSRGGFFFYPQFIV